MYATLPLIFSKMAKFSLPVIFVFFEMLLLEIIFSTSIQVSPSKGGETPPFVVTNILLQSPWVKTPLHSHCPWMNLPNNPWASQLWVKTCVTSGSYANLLPLRNFSQLSLSPWILLPECHQANCILNPIYGYSQVLSLSDLINLMQFPSFSPKYCYHIPRIT